MCYHFIRYRILSLPLKKYLSQPRVALQYRIFNFASHISSYRPRESKKKHNFKYMSYYKNIASVLYTVDCSIICCAVIIPTKIVNLHTIIIPKTHVQFLESTESRCAVYLSSINSNVELLRQRVRKNNLDRCSHEAFSVNNFDLLREVTYKYEGISISCILQ